MSMRGKFLTYVLLPLVVLATYQILQFREMKKLENRFCTISELSTIEVGKLRQYLNPSHLKAAEENGVLIYTVEDIHKYIGNGLLQTIKNNNGYELTALKESYPYLTNTAAQTLKSVGERFHEILESKGLPKYDFYVTSLLRTELNQEELEKKNPNASPLTSHRYGTTIDIYYGDYLYPDLFFSKIWRFFHLHAKKHIWGDEIDKILPAWNYQQFAFKHGNRIKAILGRLLIEMQDEGVLLVIHEKQVSVFHVTLM